MKVIRYTKYGDPWDVAMVHEEPMPIPTYGEVRVKIEAAPIHIADLKCIRGEPNFRMFPLPAIPGFEGIGNIDAIGPGNNDWKIGDRVFLPLACGAWREHISVKSDEVWSAPNGDPSQLSLLPINPMTAELMLRDFGDLQSADWIIQNAANSSCGLYLIALAKLKGIRTINVVRRESTIPLLEEAGGDINLVDGPDLHNRVQKLAGNVPIKMGVDAIAGNATTRLGACLTDGGIVLNYGMLSGEPCELPPDMVFLRDIQLRGFYTARQMARRTKEEVQDIYKVLATLVSTGEIKARIAATFPLEEVSDACRLANEVAEARPGKVIFHMNQKGESSAGK